MQQLCGVYLGVKTCEVFLCFLSIIFLGSIVLTSQWLLCIHCFTSLISFTSFYTEISHYVTVSGLNYYKLIAIPFAGIGYVYFKNSWKFREA